MIAALIGLAVGMGYLLPSGDEMTYTKTFSSNRSAIRAIYLRDISRNIEGRLTARYGLNALPKWSPDGQRIAYLSLNDGVYYPYVMDAMGGNKHQLQFPFTTIDSGYIWSPDSQWILFSATVEGVQQSAVVHVTTGEILILPQAVGSAIWSPDSQTIIHQIAGEDAVPHLYGMNINCFRAAQPCEFKELTLLQNQAIYTNPVWSPNGHYLSFITNTGQGASSKVSVVSLRCGDLVESCITKYTLAGDKAYAQAPIWSADSQQLAYIASSTEIGIVQVESGGIHTVTLATGIAFLQSWSPDGKFVRYVADASIQLGDSLYYVLDTQTGDSYPLFPNSITLEFPEWRPRPH